MKNKLVMTLSVEGIEKQRLEAELSQSSNIINIINSGNAETESAA